MHACDVGGPVDSTNMLNGNAHLAQDSMPIIEAGFALAYRTGVNKGPGFWFAALFSLLSYAAQNGGLNEMARAFQVTSAREKDSPEVWRLLEEIEEKEADTWRKRCV